MPTDRTHQQRESANDPSVDGDQPTATPDQDGPHDVPDDEVIEKTLPAGTTGGGSGNADSSGRAS